MNTFAGIHDTNPILCRRLAFVLLPRNVTKNPLTTKQTRILGNCESNNCFNFKRMTSLNTLLTQGLPTLWHLRNFCCKGLQLKTRYTKNWSSWEMNFVCTTQNLPLSVSKNHHLLIKENNLLKSFRVICHIHVIRLLRWAMVQYSKILLCLKSSERNILDSKNFLVE